MKVSVVILNYNVKYHLDACLQTLFEAMQNIDGEILVADNNSSDGSREYFRNKYRDKVKFLWFDNNMGFAKAYNKTVEQAQGEYLLILNPDTLIPEDAIEKLLQFADQKKDVGIIGGKMIDGTGQFLPESKRGIPTPWTAFWKISGIYKILNFPPFNKYYAPHLKQDETGPVEILTGAFMFMKKKLYEEVGGFDERYFMFGEDIDLSYSVLLQGKTNYYYPKVKIIHFKGESTIKDKSYVNNFLEATFQFQKKFFRTFALNTTFLKLFFKTWIKLKIRKNKKMKDFNYKTAFYYGDAAHVYFVQRSGYPKIIHLEDIDMLIPGDRTLIIDMTSIKFSKIIPIMEQLSKKNVKFRFYFPKNNLLIGSDSKDQLGIAYRLN
jgi:GT2 family glycosyltransferase